MSAVRIRQGWYEAGRTGVRLGPDVHVGGQFWIPVLWDDEDDPTFHKAAGLIEEPGVIPSAMGATEDAT